MYKQVIYLQKSTGERLTKNFWVKGSRLKGGLSIKDEDREGIQELINDPDKEYWGSSYKD